jgi:hypothetical protein
LEGCDPADGAPAASLVAGTGDFIALPEGARHVIVRDALRGRMVDPAQLRARHPAVRRVRSSRRGSGRCYGR